MFKVINAYYYLDKDHNVYFKQFNKVYYAEKSNIYSNKSFSSSLMN